LIVRFDTAAFVRRGVAPDQLRQLQVEKKITFPAVYGIEASRAMAEEERLAAHLALQPFDDRAQRLKELADLVVRRSA